MEEFAKNQKYNFEIRRFDFLHFIEIDAISHEFQLFGKSYFMKFGCQTERFMALHVFLQE